jgi:hypothetical protein
VTETDITVPPGVRMQQLLSGFAVSQALDDVAELGKTLHSAIEATFTSD